MFKVACSLTTAFLLATTPAFGATDIDSLVDPTRPLLYTNAGEGGLFDDMFGTVETLVTSYSLSSILIRNEDRIAVINDKRVRPGDSVGTARVNSIEPKYVILEQDGEQITLELLKGSIKTLVTQDAP